MTVKRRRIFDRDPQDLRSPDDDPADHIRVRADVSPLGYTTAPGPGKSKGKGKPDPDPVKLEEQRERHRAKARERYEKRPEVAARRAEEKRRQAKKDRADQEQIAELWVSLQMITGLEGPREIEFLVACAADSKLLLRTAPSIRMRVARMVAR